MRRCLGRRAVGGGEFEVGNGDDRSLERRPEAVKQNKTYAVVCRKIVGRSELNVVARVGSQSGNGRRLD